jgi:hypothetical protein
MITVEKRAALEIPQIDTKISNPMNQALICKRTFTGERVDD